MYNDTITAISTPIGYGGIGIVRISGQNALDIIKKIFKTKKNLKTHRIYYGHIVENDTIIDEVLVSVMLAPNTYTKEDVVEINCHGGFISVQKVLETVLKNGARLATQGEFTKRAFLNGRIDLSEAEAVIDIINAKTSLSQQIGIKQLEGKLKNKINSLRDEIVKLIANIEASIDYPEHDMEELNIKTIDETNNKLLLEIDKLISSSKNGQLIKNGIETAILGKPNVGKSSLLNNLLYEERAIVTDIPGTTRDVIKETINIDGIPLNLIDTAGIRETTDIIEKMGVSKSIEYSNTADLILYLIDVNKQIEKEELDFLNNLNKNKVIILANKTDLEQICDLNLLNSFTIIKTSVKNNFGIDELKAKIKHLFYIEQLKLNQDVFVTNIRQTEALINCKNSLINVKNSIINCFTEDFLSIDLKDAYMYLGEITGETLKDDIIDRIFSDFCLGK